MMMMILIFMELDAVVIKADDISFSEDENDDDGTCEGAGGVGVCDSVRNCKHDDYNHYDLDFEYDDDVSDDERELTVINVSDHHKQVC